MALGDPVTGGLGVLAGRALKAQLAHRLLLSPRFVNWVSSTLQLKPTDWNGLGASLGRLASMRLLEPALADDLQELELTARFALARRESEGGRRPGP